MKIQNKIIYILLTLFIGYTLLFSVFIYYSISKYAFTDFYKRLEIRAITTAKSQLENQNDADIIRELRQEYLEKLQDEHIEIFKLEDVGNARDFTSGNDYNQKFVEETLAEGKATYNNKNSFYYGAIYTTALGEDFLIIISAENYFITHHITYLRNLLFSSLIIAFLLIFLISYLFSRRIISPINNIINKVKEIGSENLHLRLESKAQNSDDIIGNLSQTFNDMLNRLETSFESQKNFISNASHELKTPLTTIIGEADVALSRVRQPSEYVESLQIILEEADKLDKKTKALLMLAQTGFDGKSQKLVILRTDQLILDVKDTVEKINPQSQIHIDFSFLPENPFMLKVYANESLLHLALCNILLNACKYSDNKPVNVGVGVADKHVVFIIKDQGIGIPESEMQFIYDPYFRASNTKKHEGYGIGLPLARNIVKIHKGQLDVNSIVGEGTTVKVTIPCAKIEHFM